MSRTAESRRTRLMRHADYLDRQGRRDLAAALRDVIEALELGIGTGCRTFTGAAATCADDPDRTKGAEYSADAWCDGCIAREALK